jgi:hypothetical protein
MRSQRYTVSVFYFASVPVAGNVVAASATVLYVSGSPFRSLKAPRALVYLGFFLI